MTAGQGRLKFLVFIGAATALQSHALKPEIKQGIKNLTKLDIFGGGVVNKS